MLSLFIRSIIDFIFLEVNSNGIKSVIWDATNNLNQLVSAGMYLYRINAGEFHSVKKMILLNKIKSH